jgi:hypothetical protein
MDEEKLSEYRYESFPTLVDLCEMDSKDVIDQAGYLFTLYGMAIGYLTGRHPAKAWMELGANFIKYISDISQKQWQYIAVKIADKLEERQREKYDI